ncbi:MAG: tetratricopeptide repeat protein [Acidobacteriota bacterium]
MLGRWFSLPPAVPGAHAGLDEAIALVTERIGHEPGNAELYRMRGDLYREGEDFRRSRDDYEHARTLEPSLPGIDLRIGRAALEAGRSGEALAALDVAILCEPGSVEAFLLRARTNVALGRAADAVADFDRALDLSVPPASPQPELYIERARAAVADGDRQGALRGLDRGLGRLGPLITLDLEALDIELSIPDPQAALARLDRIAARSARKEQWLSRRGDILASLGERREARAAFEAALKALSLVPSSRRETPATRALEAHVQSSLALLAKEARP